MPPTDPNERANVSVAEFANFRDVIVAALGQNAKQFGDRFDTFEDRIDRRFETQINTTNGLLKIAGEHQALLKEHERRINGQSHVMRRTTGPSQKETKDAKDTNTDQAPASISISLSPKMAAWLGVIGTGLVGGASMLFPILIKWFDHKVFGGGVTP